MDSRSFWAAQPVLSELGINRKTLPQPFTPNTYQKPKVGERGKRKNEAEGEKERREELTILGQSRENPMTTASERLSINSQTHGGHFPFTLSPRL